MAGTRSTAARCNTCANCWRAAARLLRCTKPLTKNPRGATRTKRRTAEAACVDAGRPVACGTHCVREGAGDAQIWQEGAGQGREVDARDEARSAAQRSLGQESDQP